jgi:hypothetical protein
MVYDYSGNLQHASIPNGYSLLSTDRGIASKSGTVLSISLNLLTSTFTQGYSDFTISFWG